MNRPHPITDWPAILAAHPALSSSDLGRLIGRHGRTVHDARKRHGFDEPNAVLPWSTEDVRRLEDLHAEGWTSSRIAGELGRTTIAVVRRLAYTDRPRLGRDWASVLAQYPTLTDPEIAVTLAVHVSVVRKARARLGLPKGPKVKPSPGKAWSKADVAELQRLAKTGAKSPAIGQALGRTSRAVDAKLEDLADSAPKRTVLDWPSIFRDNPGATNQQIADRYGVHPQSVRVKRFKLEGRGRHDDATGQPRNIGIVIPPSEHRPELPAGHVETVAEFLARGGSVKRIAAKVYVEHRAVPAFLS